MDREDIKLLKEFIPPHLALTFFKFKAKVTNYLKKANIEITPEQFVLLNIISQFPGITQYELTNMVYKDKSNLSRMLDGLENKGYLNRILDTKGSRVVKRLSITPKGIRSVDRITPMIKILQDNTTKGISREELDTLKDILARIRKNLETDF